MLLFWSTLAAVVEIAGILTAIHAIMDTRTPQGAVAWAAVLILLPYIGLPAYWVFGRSKFRGYVLRRRRHSETSDPVADEIFTELEQRGLLADPGREHSKLVESLARLPFTTGNDVELLTDGAAVFASILEGIRAAREYVLLEFYIVEDDRIGRELQERLIEAAQRRVRVRMIYDEIGSFGLDNAYVEKLRAAGVEVFSFHTRRGWINRWQFNFRNHRKLVITDGQTAWVGGFNVTDDGLGRNPDIGPWRDTHVKLTGPIVPCVQLAFFEDWLWATEKELELTWEPQLAPSGARRNALALLSGPADTLETCTLFFLHAISSAKHRLWIASPYFVPDEQFFSALKLASLRGVDVRILVPRKPDHILVYLSGWSAMTELTSAGIRFYRYRDGFMHQKVMLMDDEYCTVGTANFDNRSFRLNFELTIAFADAAFGAEVRAMLERDFAVSDLVRTEELETIPYWRRLTMKLARLTAPVQ